MKWICAIALLLGSCAPPGHQGGKWSTSGVITARKQTDQSGKVVSIDAVLEGQRLTLGGVTLDEVDSPLILVRLSGGESDADLSRYDVLGGPKRYKTRINLVKIKVGAESDHERTQMIAEFDRSKEMVNLWGGKTVKFEPGMRIEVIVDEKCKVESVNVELSDAQQGPRGPVQC